jgi:putative ABC transport system permease protein
MKRWWGRGRALRHSRLQTVLAVVSIAIAVALPVVLVSVGGGVSSHELANIENAGYQLVVSAPGVHGITSAHKFSQSLLSIAGITAASPTLTVQVDAYASSKGNATSIFAEGVLPDQFSPTLGPTESGLFPSPLPLGDPTDSVHYAGGNYSGPATDDAIIASTFADTSHLAVGDTLLLSPTANRTLGTEYLVTGTFNTLVPGFGPAEALTVVVPLSDLQVLAGVGKGNVGAFDAADSVQLAVAGSIADNPTALAHLKTEVQAHSGYYSVTSLSQEAAQLQSASGLLTGFYLALSSVGLTVGLLFLALVLLRRVESDRRSIGIRRALGLSGRSIAREILVGGAILALLGGATGVVAGYLIVEVLATWATSAVREAAQLAVFSPLELTELVAGVVGLSLLAGAVATRAALRIPITEALR